MSVAFRGYWQRKELLSQRVPYFPVRRWWDGDDLSEIERTYLQEVSGASSVLDVGAGNLRVMRKLQRAGYKGEYHTQDISNEYSYTYGGICEIQRTYAAILCLDVLEHLALEDGLRLIDTLIGLLDNGGVFILQTANARCANNPLSWDMTHLHLYNTHDLWAYLATAGLQVQGYRVVFVKRRRSPFERARFAFSKFVATQCLGMDYAHNIALIARRTTGPRGPLP